MSRPPQIPPIIYYLQVASLSLIWIFVGAITAWIFNLIFTAIALDDAPNASVGISLVVIPVFIILASVLSYVFFGLQREPRGAEEPAPPDQPGESL